MVELLSWRFKIGAVVVCGVVVVFVVVSVLVGFVLSFLPPLSLLSLSLSLSPLESFPARTIE